MLNEDGKNAVETLLKANGVIVIIGAGVSVSAGIPSFRGVGSMEERLEPIPVRDIMSARIREDATLCNEHAKFIACLANKATAARPTLFHRMLRALDNANILVRLYTQNIDGIEAKVGFDLLDRSTKARCIALHGSLTSLRCDNCSSTRSLESCFQLLKSGGLPICSNTERSLASLRKRKGSCGVFYPDIALYDEAVKDEEYISAVATEDLRKLSKNTMLLVVGTSLTIPGVANIVRNFSSVLHSKGGKSAYIDADPNISSSLHKCFGEIVKMDCNIFAREVIAGLKMQGAEEMQEADLREDMRPLWDWE